MALLLALIIAVITVISMYLFTTLAWHMPPFISEYGAAYDSHFKLTLTVVGIIFFFAQLGLAYVVFRYRDQAAGPAIPTGTTRWRSSGRRPPSSCLSGWSFWGSTSGRKRTCSRPIPPR